MSKADKFRAAIEKVQDMNIEPEYMADMNNWCVVHATRYLPRKNPDGSLFIPSTGMATDFRFMRSTVHVTLNHVVQANNGGSWDDTPIVVLTPYTDVVKKNGNPVHVSGLDTFWSVSPDTGLVLPKTAYVVQPDNHGSLYKIGKDGATYKRDNYTEEEIAIIESMLDPETKEKYMKYKNGDINEQDIEHLGGIDKRVRKMYENAKDKKAFLRGLFEEACFNILAQCLRDTVVKMSMQKMGKMWVRINDYDAVSETIYKTATSKGIEASAGKYGHDGTLFATTEDMMESIIRVLYGVKDTKGLFQMHDMKSIYDFMSGGLDEPIWRSVLFNLIDNKPIAFEKIYQDAYAKENQSKINYIEGNVIESKNYLNEYMNGVYSNLGEEEKNKWIQEYQNRILVDSKMIEDMSKKKTIADFDKNLGETVKRHCKRLAREYNAWRKKLETQPGFDKLVQDLRTLVATRLMTLGGRDY